MKQVEVNLNEFKVESILYDDSDFLVAVGIWNNKSKEIGLKWNTSESNQRYSNELGNSKWFILPSSIRINFLKSIIINKYSKTKFLFIALADLQK